MHIYKSLKYLPTLVLGILLQAQTFASLDRAQTHITYTIFCSFVCLQYSSSNSLKLLPFSVFKFILLLKYLLPKSFCSFIKDNKFVALRVQSLESSKVNTGLCVICEQIKGDPVYYIHSVHELVRKVSASYSGCSKDYCQCLK